MINTDIKTFNEKLDKDIEYCNKQIIMFEKKFRKVVNSNRPLFQDSSLLRHYLDMIQKNELEISSKLSLKYAINKYKED